MILFVFYFPVTLNGSVLKRCINNYTKRIKKMFAKYDNGAEKQVVWVDIDLILTFKTYKNFL